MILYHTVKALPLILCSFGKNVKTMLTLSHNCQHHDRNYAVILVSRVRHRAAMLRTDEQPLYHSYRLTDGPIVAFSFFIKLIHSNVEPNPAAYFNRYRCTVNSSCACPPDLTSSYRQSLPVSDPSHVVYNIYEQTNQLNEF